MSATTHPSGVQNPTDSGGGASRRDFLYFTTTGVGAVGLAAFAWPLIHSMNPSADTLALASVEVDLSPIQEGQSITVTWRGKPVFIRRRTTQEIQSAQKVELAELRDPTPDTDRVQKPEWLILIGVCTHLGCVPLGQTATDPRGDFGGWFCPCHGSHYDTSGRIRKGPAPANLRVPEYKFITDSLIRIG
jgi:ubiquinol-cytochrome c reductase iron-sulfur subunit